MSYRFLSDIRLSDLFHIYGCLYAHRTTKTFEHVCYSKRIHSGSKHTYMVSSYSVHILA